MKDVRLKTISTLLYLFCAAVAYAQQPQPTAAVPKLVRFSGSFRPANGLPTQSVESATLAVYRDQTGGTVLWQEIQNVAVDAEGHYSLLMGATQNEGMPLDLFSSGEPRWLAVQFNRPGETEQPRVLLVSVPYALKASDAETLGGRPAAAYLLAAPSIRTGTHETGATATATSATTPAKPKATPQNSGMPNFIGKFTNTTDLIDSSMYEVGGNVGISTIAPLISLDVRTGSLPQMGIAGTTDYLTFFASDVFGPAIYWDPAKDMRFGKGGASLYNPFGFVEHMRIQSATGNVGIGTQTPGSKLDVAGDVNLSGSLLYQGTTVLGVPGGLSNKNTALGLGALASNTANFNTASGYHALYLNTTGGGNTATGTLALQSNTIGTGNTAVGFDALEANTTGINNTASGELALQTNTTGRGSTAIGMEALANNTTGDNNIAIGQSAAISVSGGGRNNIHIGSFGSADDNQTIRIGDPDTHTSFFAAGVRGSTTTNNDAIPIMIDSAGQLGTVSSSRRFKEDIQAMGAASHDLMRLRPVTYRYKRPFADGSKPIQYGLIAEEVAEVYPDLVAHSANGQIETVKYQVLDSMLLNEVQRQQAEIRSLQKQIDELKAGLALVSGAAKVSSVQ